MAFQTVGYFLFLTLMLAAYYALPQRCRWALLLLGSYYAYMCWNAAYGLLLLGCTALTYACGRLMGRAQTARAKKGWLVASLAVNLSVLVFYKYYGLLSGTVNTALGGALRLPEVDVLLPVGISFYIFQATGYTIDVYRGTVQPERHFGKYALFVSFFPQVVSGPIGRAGQLLPQLEEKHAPDYAGMRRGAVLILVGLVKKLVISDHLTLLVDRVYGDVSAYGAPAILVALVCFSFQIYCDFAGYSDIAVGSAKLFGIDLIQNFNKPYFARSIGEFWRRWHISLSSWFRDYVYIPLGGSRVKTARWAFNILVVFLLSGLWHGAAWTFCVWGLLNGLYQVLGRFTKAARDRAYKKLGIASDGAVRTFIATLCTFVLATFAWMFFRATSFAQVGQMLAGLTRWEFASLKQLVYLVNGTECLLIAVSVAALVAVEWLCGKRSLTDCIARMHALPRWIICLGLLFVLILFGKYNETPNFIYFQF